MNTPHGPERRTQGLGRSGAAGVHRNAVTRSEVQRQALLDQDTVSMPRVPGSTIPIDVVDDSTWCCPMCGTTSPPRETPAGTYCTGPCRQKLITCCEGAPSPERGA